MNTPHVFALWQQESGSCVVSDRLPLMGEEAEFVTDIPEPELIVFPAVAGQHTGTAVIICPGGGYGGLALASEGYECAQWLATQGITGMVLKYRQPQRKSHIPLDDLHSAMRFVRARAQVFHLRPDRIGVAGFSAGGHLAAQASTLHTPDTRPDFALLYYPVISLDAAWGDTTANNLLGDSPTPEAVERYSCHLQVSSTTPPTLIMMSDDDSLVSPVHSLLYYEALKKYHIPASLHIFPQGDHAWGFRGFNDYISAEPFRYMDEVKNLTARYCLEEIRYNTQPRRDTANVRGSLV